MATFIARPFGHSPMLALLGRILLSAIFILSGVTKIQSWNETLAYLGSVGLPASPVLLGAAAAIEIIGGLSVLFGAGARVGSFALFLYLLPTTYFFHRFWAFTGTEMQMQMIQFLKNLCIMGGLLQVTAFGPGRYSIDGARGSPDGRLEVDSTIDSKVRPIRAA